MGGDVRLFCVCVRQSPRRERRSQYLADVLKARPSSTTHLEVVCAKEQLVSSCSARAAGQKEARDAPHSVTMFLWPCEMALRTLISLRICSRSETSVSKMHGHFKRSSERQLEAAQGARQSCATHHVLAAGHEALVDDLRERERQHRDAAGLVAAAAGLRQPCERSSSGETHLARIVLACTSQKAHVEQSAPCSRESESRTERAARDAPVLMCTHSVVAAHVERDRRRVGEVGRQAQGGQE